MFRTGDGLLRQDDKTTDDGLKQIFATNLFGHFLLVRIAMSDIINSNLFCLDLMDIPEIIAPLK